MEQETSLQKRVGAVLGDDAVGLALLGLVLGLELVGDAVVLLGEPLFGFESGDATGAWEGLDMSFSSRNERRGNEG